MTSTVTTRNLQNGTKGKVDASEEVSELVFKAPISAKVKCRWGHRLESHPDWRSRGWNSGPLGTASGDVLEILSSHQDRHYRKFS